MRDREYTSGTLSTLSSTSPGPCIAPEEGDINDPVAAHSPETIILVTRHPMLLAVGETTRTARCPHTGPTGLSWQRPTRSVGLPLQTKESVAETGPRDLWVVTDQPSPTTTPTAATIKTAEKREVQCLSAEDAVRQMK
jgi:hypothetical protein